MTGITDFRGLPAVCLTGGDGASALLSLMGGQLLSWRPPGGGERLFLSEKARFESGRAIRGGIPVIFPQFGDRGPLPRHGFARLREWTLAALQHQGGVAMATLRLKDDAETRAIWPHPFAAYLTVTIGGNQADIELAVENTGSEGFAFTAALHTYLRVVDVGMCGLEGLEGCAYVDASSGTRGRDEAAILFFDGEVDRVYCGVVKPLLLAEPGRQLAIDAEGWPDVVVWNPWRDKGAALDDLEPEGFRRMVCVEAAVVERPAQLAPGESWVGRQTLVSL